MNGYLDELLCEEVRKYPHLYDSSLKDYKDAFIGCNSWREISQALGKDETFCRQRWKYLRDRYVKAAKMIKGKSCETGEKRPIPRIVVLLDWLSKFIKHCNGEKLNEFRYLDERLVEEVKKYPHLYDSSLKDYKDAFIGCNSWREISQAIGKDEIFCRQRWKYLRDRYVKAARMMKRRSDDAGGKKTPPIVVLLDWLSKFIKHRETDSNGEKLTEFSYSSDTIVPLKLECMASDLSDNDMEQNLKKEQFTPVQETVVARISNYDEERLIDDEDMCFGKMVGRTLSKMTTRNKAHARLEISQVLFKWQMVECDSAAPK
ncbi:uncharacterized protein LOC125280626 [Megalobrama amblycephala]|uniref:uncharacterized protein LOC125280626 n=1 Tax=Megalobrama amblycephala TaxID=75352 RepID=UPI002014329B|nr:uncharacterized protein LOC125280626 [Megalobrama amblycephala]